MAAGPSKLQVVLRAVFNDRSLNPNPPRVWLQIAHGFQVRIPEVSALSPALRVLSSTLVRAADWLPSVEKLGGDKKLRAIFG
eukprot:g17035.t1